MREYWYTRVSQNDFSKAMLTHEDLRIRGSGW